MWTVKTEAFQKLWHMFSHVTHILPIVNYVYTGICYFVHYSYHSPAKVTENVLAIAVCSNTWGHLRLRSDIKLCTSATWTHQWMWDIFLHKMILPEELRENMSTWPSVLSQWAFLRLYACAVKQTYLLKNWACWAFRERRRWQNVLRPFFFFFF